MTWLGEWLKHVILIVLVSVIADMLLPTKSMQKYVRAVLGIAVIAALLQPITPWFSRDWANKAASAATRELMSSQDAGAQAADGIDTLQTYERQLQTQETDQADVLLAEATLASLPASSRNHVLKITIQDATAPSALQATVVVDTADVQAQQSLEADIADVLNVRPDQITVQTSGGT